MILTTPSQRRDLLENVRSVAMVGASNNPLRPSYTVFSYLRTQSGYDVTPINPTIAEIDGVKAYPSLQAYAAEHGASRSSTMRSRPARARFGSNTASSIPKRSLLPTRLV
jgi:hypothetical protein